MNYPQQWSQAEREDYEERAAILEFMAHLPRDEAESTAFAMIELSRATKYRPLPTR